MAWDFGPVAFERILGRPWALFGSALCSDAVGAGVPVFGEGQTFAGTGAEAESLILAQNERWRRA